MNFLRSIKDSIFWPLIAPGYPDTARLGIQDPLFRELTREFSFGGICLHAGCGQGMFCPLLEAIAGITCIENVDISLNATIQDSFPDARHRFTLASLTDLPFPDATFDCCLCSEVIEHIEDHSRAVAELARVMRPGGTLLVSVPQTPAPWDPAHVRQGYRYEEMESLLHTQGFKVLARRDACYAFSRALMYYWRHPWVRFGANRCPYVPRAVIRAIAWVDRNIHVGPPWDLVVIASRL